MRDNQPTLHADVRDLFTTGMEAKMKHQEDQTQEKGHGRRETRIYHLIQPTKQWLAKHPEWKGLKTIGMVLLR